MTFYDQNWRKIWNTVDNGSICSSMGDFSGTGNNLNARLLYAFKQELVKPGVGQWFIVASCGNAGGPSLVASVDDNWTVWQDLVRGTNSSANRSWIVFRSPTTTSSGTYYMLIDWYGSDGRYCNWYFTRHQPDITSLVTNARPVSTGPEWSHLNDIIFGSDGRYYGIRHYMTRANDGSFISGYSGSNSGGNLSRNFFRSGLLFNVLAKDTCPDWDIIRAVSIRWTSDIHPTSTLSFKTLHHDNTEILLEQYVPWNQYYGSVVNTLHWDDIREKLVVFQAPLISVTSGKVAWRGSLEDVNIASGSISNGSPLYQNGIIKATRMGAWVVPITRRLVGL